MLSMMYLKKSATDRVPQNVTKFTPVSGGASLGPSSRLEPWQPEQFEGMRDAAALGLLHRVTDGQGRTWFRLRLAVAAR